MKPAFYSLNCSNADVLISWRTDQSFVLGLSGERFISTEHEPQLMNQ